jgi:hypothetical protein
MITAPLLSMLVVPVAYLLLRRLRAGSDPFFRSPSLKGEVR